MKWPASGQLPGRDPNGGYARRRLGGSASDVGSIPTASTIAGPSAKPVPNGRFAEGLCFARVLRGFRDLRRSGASSENAGDASSQGRKRGQIEGGERQKCVRNADCDEKCGSLAQTGAQVTLSFAGWMQGDMRPLMLHAWRTTTMRALRQAAPPRWRVGSVGSASQNRREIRRQQCSFEWRGALP